MKLIGVIERTSLHKGGKQVNPLAKFFIGNRCQNTSYYNKSGKYVFP